METTKLSSKGQIVLPKFVRETLGWRQGMEFCIEARKEGVLLRPARPFEPTQLHEVIGSAGYAGARVSAADMQAAVRNGLKARHGHGRRDGRR